jgi:hypothetical protein
MTIKMQDEIVSNEYNKGGNSNLLSTYDNLSFLFTHMFCLHLHVYVGTCRNLFMLYDIEGKK